MHKKNFTRNAIQCLSFSGINNNNNWNYVVEKKVESIERNKLINKIYRCFHKEITFQFNGSAFSLLEFCFEFFCLFNERRRKNRVKKGDLTTCNMKLKAFYAVMHLKYQTGHTVRMLTAWYIGETRYKHECHFWAIKTELLPLSKTIFG